MIENGFDWQTWGKARVELPDGYTLGDFISKGTRGEVYGATRRRKTTATATDSVVGEEAVAIKILRDYRRALYSSDLRYRRDCLLSVVREVHILGLLSSNSAPDANNSSVLPLVDVYVSADRADLYLVMPRAAQTVRGRLSASSTTPSPTDDGAAAGQGPANMTEAEARAVMRGVLSGLAALHGAAGYAHLDVNSANVLLMRDASSPPLLGNTNSPPRAALADFSFCRPLCSPLNTSGIVALGYRAPELLFLGGYGGRAALIAELARAEEAETAASEGGKDGDKRFRPSYDLAKADIFAAGVLMCEMLLGRLPVTGLGTAKDFSELAAAVPSAPPSQQSAKEQKEDPASPLPPPPVEADVAARRQFLALFHNLVPTFDEGYWAARYAHYKALREAYPSAAVHTEDEVPLLDAFSIDADDATEIKIKPKVTDGLEERGALSPLGASFLKLLIAETPEQRPSAAELLCHPWLCDGAAPSGGLAAAGAAVSVPQEPDAFALLSLEDMEAWVEARTTAVAASTVMVQKR